MKLTRLLLASPLLLLLAACQPDLSPDSYDYYGGTGGTVHAGVIQDIQYNVKVNKDTGAGGLAGAVAGGAMGSTVNGGGGAGSIVGMVGGAVLGGIVGNTVEKSVSRTTATLYIVKITDSNRMVSVIQQSPAPLCIGDHVYIIGSSDRPRLKLDDGYYASGEHTRQACTQPSQ